MSSTPCYTAAPCCPIDNCRCSIRPPRAFFALGSTKKKCGPAPGRYGLDFSLEELNTLFDSTDDKSDLGIDEFLSLLVPQTDG